jgi:hypothetical protein
MRRFFFLFFLGCPIIGFSQLSTLSGTVVDQETKQSIEGANVFLGSTSLGASSDKAGKFIVSNVPLGYYDLLISMIGYETLTTRVQLTLKNPSYAIELQKKTTELSEVSVTADTAGWYNNYLGFTDLFLGKTKSARASKIRNPRELIFYFDPKDGFYAHAKNPLVIENKVLGYTVTYHLQKFERNYETGVQYALGIPLFRDTNADKIQPRRIRKARSEAYNGSLMHFFRALKQRRLEAEGFTVFEVFKIKNINRPDQEYIKRKMEQWKMIGGDSLNYYSRLNSLPKEVDSLGYRFRTGEELITSDENPAAINFTGMLRVIYTKELEEQAFIVFGNRPPGPQQSTLHLMRNGVKVYDNGYYEEPNDILLDGYLGWSEKIGDMLPLNYVPSVTD